MTFPIDTWLKAMKRKTSRGVRNARRVNRMPRLEVLEDRTLPSTLTVTNPSDTGVAGDGSLRGEIAAAQNGDTITFDPSLAAKTITLTSGELLVTQNISIVGPTPANAAQYLTLNGNNNGRVFNIENSGTANVSLTNLKITGGTAGSSTPNIATAGGGLLIDITAGTVTLDNVMVNGNRDTRNDSTSPVAAQGGGLAFVGGKTATLVLKHGGVTNNLAQGFGDAQGGGIYAVGGSVSLTNEFIQMNTAQGQKGLQGAKPTTKNGGYLPGGVGGTGGLAQGGGLYVAGSTITMAPDCSINANKAQGGTGGPGGFNGGWGGQGGDGQGGGIYMTGGVFSLNGSSQNSATGLSNNRAVGGFGGFGGKSNHIALGGSLNAGNGGAGGNAFGGTLYLASGTVNLINSSEVQGTAIAGTGAFGASGGPHLSNSAIGGGNGGNGGSAFGGGIYVAKGALTFTNDSYIAGAQGNLSGIVHGGRGGTGGHGSGKGASGGNSGNGGNASGGGLYIAGGTVTLIGNTLGGSDAFAGDSYYAGTPSPPSFDTNGKAHYGAGGIGGAGGSAYGGGAYIAAGNVSLIDDTLSGNQVRGGQGGYANDFAAPINGQAGGDGFGGGLYVAGGTVNLIDDTFGGISSFDSSRNTVYGGLGGFAGNGAAVKSLAHQGANGGGGGGAYGGGLFVANGSVSLTNDTLSNNSLVGGNGAYGGDGVSGASGGGGGNGGNVKGGGLFFLNGTLTLANTLIAQNSTVPGTGGLGGKGTPAGSQGANGTITGPDVAGAPTSSDHDLIGNNSGFNPVTSTGDVVNVTANLGPMQNNGGPTNTMGLLAGSPAIDAGDNNVPGLPADDQRGYSRIVGAAVDIGAYEFGAGPATADLSITGHATPIVVPGGSEQIDCVLTVTNNSSTAQSNVTVADLLPANTTFVSWTVPGGWSSSAPAVGSGSGNMLTWIASLAANSSATFTLVVNVNKGTPAGTVITDTATVGPVSGDPTPGDNLVTLTPTLSTNLNIPPVSLPSAQEGVSYKQSLSANGGTSPYQFALVNGQGTGLPAGLTLNSDGTITGTPTVSGTFTFEAQVTDSSPAPGPFTQTSSLLTLMVNAPTGGGGGGNTGGTGGGNTGGGGTEGGNTFVTVATSTGAGADFVNLAIEEFELTIDMLLVLIEGMGGQPHADLDASIAQLQSAIANDSLLPTSEGQLALLLGESAAWNALSGA